MITVSSYTDNDFQKFKNTLKPSRLSRDGFLFRSLYIIRLIWSTFAAVRMKYIWQHIQSIISTYDGSVPLTHFLKSYYKRFPILGSRDRKILSDMAYSWYRCAKGITEEVGFEEKVLRCLYICQPDNKHISRFIPEEWQQAKPSAEDLSFDIDAITPFTLSFSDEITKQDWLRSMLHQPDMFIRIRKNKTQAERLLKENNISYKNISDTCISIPNGTTIDKILPVDCYVVQDASSQYTGTYFYPQKNETWWDCCSGAGGKSLLLKDMEPSVALTVSDKRDTILHNLQDRFRQYRLTAPTSCVLDITDALSTQKKLQGKIFDNIICDVPCSGSGTWSRTPEQLYFFKPEAVSQFSELQKTIAINASAYLKEGGRLIYITCSVFKGENEGVVDELIKKTGLELIEQELINGIGNHADSMFITVLRK